MAETGFLLGVDFGGSKTALATANSDGLLGHREVLQVAAGQPAATTLGAAIEAAQRLIEATTAETGLPCRGIGVATPGIVGDSGVALSPNLTGWDSLPLERVLRERLGVARVKVANDVKCAARAEVRWGALRGADPAFYLNLGTGVAAAVVVGGRIVEGAHGGAGEIGYGGFWSPESPTKISLEELVGGRGLAVRATEIVGRAVTTEEALDAVPETPLHGLVESALEGLACHLRNVVLVLDPARIAIGGGLMGRAGRILDALRPALEVPTPLGAELVPARFPHDAPLRGAIALLLDGDDEASTHADGTGPTAAAREGR